MSYAKTIILSSLSVNQNAPAGSIIAELSVESGESVEFVKYSGGENSYLVEVVGSTLKLNDYSSLNVFEIAPTFIEVNLRVNDAYTPIQTFTINVVNQAPSSVALSSIMLDNGITSLTVPESAQIGYTVATIGNTSSSNYLFSTDPEEKPLTFSLPSGVLDNDNFEIIKRSELTPYELVTKALLDYETKNELFIKIIATDDINNSSESIITVHVINENYDINLSPTDFSFYTQNSVYEDASEFAYVGTFNSNGRNNQFVVDSDMNSNSYSDRYTYTLVNGTGSDDNYRYVMHGECVLKVGKNAQINYQQKPQHSIRVQIQDPQGGTFQKVFIINVVDNSLYPSVQLSSQRIFMFNSSEAVANISVNPTTTPVMLNGLPLPTGSLLKNTATGQKFIKIDGSATAYMAISITVPVDWNLGTSGQSSWSVLQNM